MIASDSPLRRLPAHIDRKQALFLDGIRHAAEIAAFSYARLSRLLAEAALTEEGQVSSYTFVEPFVDAWSVVDAVDRMRGLLKLMPGLTFAPSADGRPRFLSATDAVREVRNVADHLAQRAEYVVAKEGTALGVLTWVTPIDDRHARSCVLRPGIVKTGKTVLNNPVGRAVRIPSDFIVIEAGEHKASLSDAIDAMRTTVAHLESAMAKAFISQGLHLNTAGSDVLFVAHLEMLDPPAS